MGCVAAHVPFVDVLNTMLNADLPLTPIEWPEWGNPIEDPNVFDYIRSYSPYDQVEAVDYPPIFVTAGLNDPRVTYWEPAKWVAKLRSKKTDQNLILLKTNMTMGHGGNPGDTIPLKKSLKNMFSLLPSWHFLTPRTTELFPKLRGRNLDKSISSLIHGKIFRFATPNSVTTISTSVRRAVTTPLSAQCAIPHHPWQSRSWRLWIYLFYSIRGAHKVTDPPVPEICLPPANSELICPYKSISTAELIETKSSIWLITLTSCV